MGFEHWFDFSLPWRKRRRAINEEIQDENLTHLNDENFLNILSNEDNSNIRFKYRENFYGHFNENSSTYMDFTMPSMIMAFEELGNRNQQLIKLLYQGNIEGFKTYSENFSSKDINQIEFAGQGLLHILCFKCDIEMLKIALTIGCDVNQVNIDGVTPLHLAVSECWTEGVQILLVFGASANIFPKSNINSNWPYKELPLLTAARNGDFETSFLLLEQNPNLLLTDSEKNTILHLSCFSHCEELISRLLDKQIIVNNISDSNSKGNSSIHMLFTGPNLSEYEDEIHECVKLLLQKGVNINNLNTMGETELYLAALANLPIVVKTLLQSGANPTIKNIYDKTVLHAACKSSSHESLSMLLKTDMVSNLIQVEDKFGYSPFHVAISSCSINCCEILLLNGDHLTNLDSKGRSRCSLLKDLPTSLTLLKKLFDANIELSDKDVDDPEFRIKMNFSIFLSKSSEYVETSLISDLGSSGMDTLLKHPLIETFLHLKWHKIRILFYTHLLLYTLFVIVHTFYVIKTYGMNTDWELQKGVLRTTQAIYIILISQFFIPDTISIFVNFKKYFKQWETLCKIFVSSTTVFLIISREAGFNNLEILKNIAAISIFFTWVEFMMLLGRFPSLGVYILMFTRVSKSIIKFIFAFSPILIAFTLTFGIVLSSIEEFNSFPTGIVRILMMMIGEMDYANIYSSTKMDTISTMIISHIFLVLFIFLIPVLMANLLIGLAVNDLPDLQYHGKIRSLLKKASYLESYERLVLVLKEYIPESITNIYLEIGAIKRDLYIYPNRLIHISSDSFKFYKFNMNLNLPYDIIKEVIASGTKKDSANDETEIPFKKFYSEYITDQDRLHSALESLMVMTNYLANKSGGIDVPDYKLKSWKKMKSRRGRK